jgi:hypothetical protein
VKNLCSCSKKNTTNQLAGDFVKNFISSIGLGVLLCGSFIFCLSFDSRKMASKMAKAQTNISPTPCLSNAKQPSNVVDPCHPAKPPSAEEIAKREKQKKDLEIKWKKIFTANYPLSSKSFADFDGDGKKDEILYQIKPFEDFYEGLLEITSAQGKVLWKDNFQMDSGDLAEWLDTMGATESAEVTITDWVNNAFNPKYNYAFEVENRKIEKREIDGSQIAYAAKLNKISAAKLRTEILAQKSNRIFTYRSTWREDLMQIVYIPSLKKFVCFARGYY